MATNLFPINSAGISPCAAAGRSETSSNFRRRSHSGNGWTPIFGWSGDADYIDSSKHTDMARPELGSDPDPKQAGSRARLTPGSFTEEKARRLRVMTKETASFHDVMYHSAIASRLASDFSHRSGQ